MIAFLRSDHPDDPLADERSGDAAVALSVSEPAVSPSVASAPAGGLSPRIVACGLTDRTKSG